MDRLLYSLDDAAAMLSISKGTLRLLIAKDYLRVRRIGRLVRIHRRDIEALAKIDIPNLWPDKPWAGERRNGQGEL